MEKILAAFLIAIFFHLVAEANVPVPPGISNKYHVNNKEIHLKYGKLHLPDSDTENEEDGHLRYRWLEDDILINESEKDKEFIEMTEKTIKLPGGCELTEVQYEELESFKKETHYVKKCYCENGGVYCQVRKHSGGENGT